MSMIVPSVAEGKLYRPTILKIRGKVIPVESLLPKNQLSQIPWLFIQI